jgi:ribosomal protein S6--L-glutamate ligase
MKAALISLGSESSKWTIEAMNKYFDTVDNVDLRGIEVNLSSEKSDVLYNGKPLANYDCIYAKGSFRYAQTLRAVTGALYPTTYMPIKAGAFTVGHDKLLTHFYLQQYKIPMPTTYLSSSPTAAKKILEKINYPIILKFPSGTGGKGVMYAESFAAASSLMDALESLRQPFLIQEYIETAGEDIRVIVVGDNVVAGMKRKALVGEKRANIHSGGKGESFFPDAHMKKIAINAAKATGSEICAVDLLESAKGPVVVEVNLSPGLQGITEATSVNVADKIAKYLYERTKTFTEKGTKKGAGDIIKEITVEKGAKEQQIVTNLDFRGERILLPKLVTAMGKFNEKDEFIVKVKKGKIEIEKV